MSNKEKGSQEVLHAKEDSSRKLSEEESLQDRLALISHYFHNPNLLRSQGCEIPVNYFREYVEYLCSDKSAAQVETLCKNPRQVDLFQVLEKVPFPQPVDPKFTFFDLFAGIGGIRIPFGGMGG